MKKYFLYKFFVYATLFTVGLLSLSYFWDPFKVFRNYDEFYDENIINGNRESICLEFFKRRKLALNDVENIIIGNSRSQAFKTDAWSEQIGVDKQKSFHYDGSSFGLYRTTNAIRYLMENNDSIKNLLIIMDVEFFSELSNPSTYMYIQPPEVSQENRLLYYYQFLKAGTHPIFLINYLIRRASGKHFGFMKYYLVAESGNHVSNNFTADLHYIYDKEIQRDSLGYYNKKVKNGVFYSRDTLLKISKPLLGYKQIDLLNQMENMIQKKASRVKVIIAPLYNQVKLNPIDLLKLKKVFGASNVHDFSGINKYTNDFRNFYESSHFKPYVANGILKEVYKK